MPRQLYYIPIPSFSVSTSNIMSSPTRTTASTSTQTSDAEKRTEAKSPANNDLSQFGPAPDGGTQAWLNAFAGFCIFFACLGFTSCFGVLQQYYSVHQLKNYSASDISWIGSLSSFIQFAGGAIGGPLFDRYGVKVSLSI
jgi:hypothetical protein